MTLTGTLGSSALGATATFTPSGWLTDATHELLDPPAPVRTVLGTGGTFSVSLLATDNTGPVPAGWTWSAGFAGITGVSPYSFSFFLPAGPLSFTATHATPAVFTAAGSAYSNGAAVVLSGASVPGGFTAGTTYYVVSASTDTFELAATAGGSGIASTGTGSGTVATSVTDISAVAPVEAAASMAAYLQIPGSAVAGYVLGAGATGIVSNSAVAWVPDGGVLIKVPAPTGATATDTPNVTAAIAKLTALGGNATLLFQDGAYQIDSNSAVIQSCSNFAVRGSGATVVTQAPNRSGLVNNTTGDLFIIADCTDFQVEGITFDGVRDTVAPLTPLTASASSAQPSVTVASGQGARYLTGQRLYLFGGLGTAEQNQSEGFAVGSSASLVVQSITAGGGSGGGDLVTFTANLSNSYAQISSTSFSDGFGVYAYAGAYLTPYQVGYDNSVAGRSLSGEDQQNALHLLNCQRFTISRVTARGIWESGVKCGTGWSGSTLTDECSDGVITDCVTYHGYDQGISVWFSQRITVKGCDSNASGWAGISLTGADYCPVIGNRVLNSYYRVPGDTASGHGINIEGGRRNQVKGNIISGVYGDCMEIRGAPEVFGITPSNAPTISAFLAQGTASGTSIQASATANLETGGCYSILDHERTEAVTVSSIVDGTHVEFAEQIRFSHAASCYIIQRASEENVVEGNSLDSPQTGYGILAPFSVRGTYKDNVVSSHVKHGLNFNLSSIGSNQLPSGQYLAGDGSTAEGNTFTHGLAAGIEMNGCAAMQVRGNRITGMQPNSNTKGIDVYGVTDSVISGNVISDLSNASGIYIALGGGAGTTVPARLTISGNEVYRTENEGIIAHTADSLTITGNVVRSCGGEGGISLRGLTHSLVSGNVANSNKTAGITIDDDDLNTGNYSTYNRITGNTCRNDGSGSNPQSGSAWTQATGIVEDGNSNFNLFIGNECDGNTSAQITTVGASTVLYSNFLAGSLTGALPLALGGTGEATAQAALNNLAGGVTSGDYLRGNGSNILLSAIQAADVPTLNQNTSGTAAGLSATLAIASGGTGQVTDPLPPWMASDSGYLAWNFDPGTLVGATAVTNNTITLIRVNIRKAISVTNVILDIGGTGGTGLVTNENFAGLYNSSGTLIGTSADQTSSWAGAGLKTIALVGGPYGLSAGTFVWVAILSNQSAGTNPSFQRGQNNSASAANAGVTVSTARWATNTTGTSLPAITPSASSFVSAAWWAALS